jgi:hypothetical protein
VRDLNAPVSPIHERIGWLTSPAPCQNLQAPQHHDIHRQEVPLKAFVHRKKNNSIGGIDNFFCSKVNNISHPRHKLNLHLTRKKKNKNFQDQKKNERESEKSPKSIHASRKVYT